MILPFECVSCWRFICFGWTLLGAAKLHSIPLFLSGHVFPVPALVPCLFDQFFFFCVSRGWNLQLERFWFSKCLACLVGRNGIYHVGEDFSQPLGWCPMITRNPLGMFSIPFPPFQTADMETNKSKNNHAVGVFYSEHQDEKSKTNKEPSKREYIQ